MDGTLPHQLQNLFAIVDYVVQLFLLQASVSDVPHPPATCGALISQNSLLPSVHQCYYLVHITLHYTGKGEKNPEKWC